MVNIPVSTIFRAGGHYPKFPLTRHIEMGLMVECILVDIGDIIPGSLVYGGMRKPREC